MKAPILNRKLVLEAPQQVPDGAGGYSTDWVVQGTLWAQITPGAGREKAVEFATVATIPFRITVRAAPEGAPSRPRPEQRFRAGARLFAIRAVTEADASAQYLTCYAEEEVAQ